MLFYQVQTSIVQLLIQQADEVCMVSPLLAEKTALMSEVFSTDDELDASEDNLDDTHENRRRDKKRKRSGSFQGRFKNRQLNNSGFWWHLFKTN